MQSENRHIAKLKGILLPVLKGRGWGKVCCVLLFLLLCIGLSVRYERRMLTVGNRISVDSVAHSYKVNPGTPLDSVEAWLEQDYRLSSPMIWRLHKRYYVLDTVVPGYYRFEAAISDREVINRLKYGKQSQYKLTISHHLRTREQVAGRLGNALLLDSAEVISRLDSNEYLAQFGLKKETATCLFLPNTYYVYWTITADELFERMQTEYTRFWNEERLSKAEALKMSPIEVMTLASIVNSETFRAMEWPNIASLYLNRLRKGMPLQADPTVVFANQIFSSRRVLRRHLAMDSPYNTYKYRGLPPGPIRCATTACIDSVLVAPKSNYLYMCANPDFSGTHVFTTTYEQHLRVARQYQNELSKRNIRK